MKISINKPHVSAKESEPRVSIRTKLVKVTMITVLIALLLASLALLVTEMLAHKNRSLQTLESLALVVADRSTGAIVYHDSELAQKNIYALRAKKDVTTACIYDALGILFAQYVRDKNKDPGCSSRIDQSAEVAGKSGDSLIPSLELKVRKLVMLNEDPIGTIVVRIDNSSITSQVYRFTPIVIVIILIALFIAYYLSTRLLRRVTSPIIQLANTAKQIATTNDYSLRAIKTNSKDEIDDLIEKFNEMIRLIANQRSELIAAKSNLEKQVSQRTEELDIARRYAEKVSSAKSEFLANMSHELRTPLTSIVGFTEKLEMESSLNKSQHEDLSSISSSSDHLLELIDDVLELSKIEAGKVDIEMDVFEIKDLVRTIMQVFVPLAQQKGILIVADIKTPCKTRYEGDRRKLRQILSNLIDNAIKFTKNGQIKLSVSKDLEKSESNFHKLIFEVEDSGIGIDSIELDSVFDTFTQTASGRLSDRGTGLGLAIARQYVNLMGGSISVTSETDKGTCFRFLIPLRVVSVPQRISTKIPAERRFLKSSQTIIRMAVADDNQQNRLLLTNILDSAGFETTTAQDGSEIVEVFKKWNPQLIWMDLKMPVLDGYHATRLIRELPNGQDVIIIAITANIMDQDSRSVVEAGFDELVGKPYKAAEIYDTIEKYFGSVLTNEIGG